MTTWGRCSSRESFASSRYLNPSGPEEPLLQRQAGRAVREGGVAHVRVAVIQSRDDDERARVQRQGGLRPFEGSDGVRAPREAPAAPGFQLLAREYDAIPEFHGTHVGGAETSDCAERNAEADLIGARFRKFRDAVGGLQVGRPVAAPRAASDDPRDAAGGIRIEAPLPHVAGKIVIPERVRGETAHRRGPRKRVACIRRARRPTTTAFPPPIRCPRSSRNSPAAARIRPRDTRRGYDRTAPPARRPRPRAKPTATLHSKSVGKR